MKWNEPLGFRSFKFESVEINASILGAYNTSNYFTANNLYKFYFVSFHSLIVETSKYWPQECNANNSNKLNMEEGLRVRFSTPLKFHIPPLPPCYFQIFHYLIPVTDTQKLSLFLAYENVKWYFWFFLKDLKLSLFGAYEMWKS